MIGFRIVFIVVLKVGNAVFLRGMPVIRVCFKSSGFSVVTFSGHVVVLPKGVEV